MVPKEPIKIILNCDLIYQSAVVYPCEESSSTSKVMHKPWNAQTRMLRTNGTSQRRKKTRPEVMQPLSSSEPKFDNQNNAWKRRRKRSTILDNLMQQKSELPEYFLQLPENHCLS